MIFLAPFRLVALVVRRFTAERLAQTSAALSFATLLGLVPMIVVVAALVDHLPFAASIVQALEKFLLTNLLPDKAGTVIANVVAKFAGRADQVTLVGIVALAMTAVMQMLTIEHAFNVIFKVRSSRALTRRLSIHGLALLLGPLLFGISLATITFVASASLGLVAEPAWVTTLVFRVLSFSFVAALFAFMYWGVPNRPVLRWHAAFGGVLAAGGFMAMQRLFSLYIVKFPAYALVYGSFAALPIFLIWLYASWTVILVGALVVAELPRATA